MANLTGIQPPPKPAEPGNQRAVTHGAYAKSPGALQVREEKVKALVGRMYEEMPWLDDPDEPSIRHWAELEVIGDSLFRNLMTKGFANRKGEPRRLLVEFRQLRQTQLTYERELGMTPSSRMGLRVGDSKGRALDAASAVALLRRQRDGG